MTRSRLQTNTNTVISISVEELEELIEKATEKLETKIETMEQTLSVLIQNQKCICCEKQINKHPVSSDENSEDELNTSVETVISRERISVGLDKAKLGTARTGWEFIAVTGCTSFI
ncbi:hypothetical protein Zmor_014836 [Zophobas morio]|uniref:Uncharacterized protein n=1 Tax=Zophobas morio TaxID=2755281 RepID=A0AA38MGQ7_9CUCU|nr:hypothetical protein Zmor_014836 [Zophobas morio]